MGALKNHLESGCGCVMVVCPNKCLDVNCSDMMLKRKDLQEHLTQFCYIRAFQCEFCGLKDTYEAITGEGYVKPTRIDGDSYFGHQATCPEAPLTCPNKCGCNKIKRKDVESHRSQCPKEPVECPFAEAGCKDHVCRHQLESHMTSSQQLHLLMVMKDYTKTKKELHEIT